MRPDLQRYAVESYEYQELRNYNIKVPTWISDSDWNCFKNQGHFAILDSDWCSRKVLIAPRYLTLFKYVYRAVNWFKRRYYSLLGKVAREGLKRGWWLYSDIEGIVLSPKFLYTIFKQRKEARKNMSDQGLKVKYDVLNLETGENISDCFVLRPDRDPAAAKALAAYAEATENQALSSDIKLWLERLGYKHER